ncbi:MAG TPA: nitroreductase family protein [Bacilli bacterium]
MHSSQSHSINPIEQLSAEVQANRESHHSTSPLFLNRWSPRAFTNSPVSEEDLLSILEAAHWAPSSSNQQPWRFITATTEEQLKVFHDFLVPSNRAWAEKAPVLVLAASYKLSYNGKPNGMHAFDTGTAWGHLALQAVMLGLSTHAMGGFEHDKARSSLKIPEDYDLHAVIAIGYQGDKTLLNESLQEREKPSGRKPLSEVVIQGKMQ